MKKPIFIFLFLIFIISCGSKTEPYKGSPGLILTPLSVTVVLGQNQQFEATLSNSTSAITWSVDGGDLNGTIDANGLYTAPTLLPSSTSVVIRAKLSSDSQVQATAQVDLSATE